MLNGMAIDVSNRYYVGPGKGVQNHLRGGLAPRLLVESATSS